MKKCYLFFSLLLAGMVLFTSCEEKEKETLLSGDVKVAEYIDATSYTDWAYFSFEKGEVVEVSDYSNDLSWDIAFHRGDIRLNGGASGKGAGEAINTNQTDWNAITEAPKSGYIKDEVGKITSAFTGTGITEEDQPFSQTLATWLTIDTSNPPPKYTYHEWVYVIKSASGKYVKLQVYDYKDAKNAGAYISFRYQCNTSGSDKF